MKGATKKGSGGRTGGVLTWLSSVLICLFLCSCAQGGGIGDVLEEGGTGGDTAGTSGNTGESTAICGDGQINGLEQCDGMNLNMATCGSLGEGTGTLNCSPTCTYDLGMCSGAGTGGAYGG